MSFLAGQSIGRYHILEQLGEGGMATVYKAYDTRLERDVAVKVLRTDQFIPAQIQHVLQRFEREAKSLAKLSHPNIVNILDYGEHEGVPYLVMEYLPGGTIKQKLGHAIPWHNAIRILIPVAQGLAYAHQHGIIHRDVKPANILLKESEVPVLTDFGIAKLLEPADGQTLTGSGVGIGTPEYMAPEQGMGAKVVDARADIYALGIVLYEMVVGRKPYVADTPMAVVLKQITDPLPRPTKFVPDLPEGVENILLKALAKRPDDRYTDMTAMIAAMESLLDDLPTPPVHPYQIPAIPKETLPESAVQPKKKVWTPPKPSPRMLLVAGGVIAISLWVIFSLPWMKKQFSAVPVVIDLPTVAATSTTSWVIAPISTPLLPTATPEPSLSSTQTKAPRPSRTLTPAPVWVKDFAEPILADIQAREPDYQDDFERKSNFWVPASFCESASRFNISNGVMEITNCHVYFTRNYDNFVVAFDYQFPGTYEYQLKFYLRQSSSFGGCCFGFKPNGEGFWECGRYNPSFLNYSGIRTEKNHVVIIVKGNRFALYRNGKPIDMIQIDPLKYGISFFTGKGQIDNFKLWRIP